MPSESKHRCYSTLNVETLVMPKFIHSPDRSTSESVRAMEELIACLSNENSDLVAKATKLKDNLDFSYVRRRELEEMITTLEVKRKHD